MSDIIDFRKAALGDLKDLIFFIVTKIVNNPGDVSEDIVQSRARLIAQLHTNKKDIGQVIGNNGHIMSSLRSLVSALGGRCKVKMQLNFITDEDNRERSFR